MKSMKRINKFYLVFLDRTHEAPFEE